MGLSTFLKNRLQLSRETAKLQETLAGGALPRRGKFLFIAGGAPAVNVSKGRLANAKGAPWMIHHASKPAPSNPRAALVRRAERAWLAPFFPGGVPSAGVRLYGLHREARLTLPAIPATGAPGEESDASLMIAVAAEVVKLAQAQACGVSNGEGAAVSTAAVSALLYFRKSLVFRSTRERLIAIAGIAETARRARRAAENTKRGALRRGDAAAAAVAGAEVAAALALQNQARDAARAALVDPLLAATLAPLAGELLATAIPAAPLLVPRERDASAAAAVWSPIERLHPGRLPRGWFAR